MKSQVFYFRSRLEELRKIREIVRNFYSPFLSETELDRVILAIDEGVANVIVHGYRNQDFGEFELELDFECYEIKAIIRDRAPEFIPRSNFFEIGSFVQNPESGLGLFLMHNIMNVEYTPREGGGNILTLRKLMKPEKN